MKEIFVDTAGWACLFVKTEPYHRYAAVLFREQRDRGARFVTTNYVLLELVALFMSPLRLPRARLIDYIEAIKRAPYVEVVHIDEELDAAGWALLKSRVDKNWSLVDAVSFVVMQERTIKEALTTDHHFEQAGFVRLLK